MPTDQEIRDICIRVSLADNPEQFKAALTELKIAIRDHMREGSIARGEKSTKAPKQESAAG
ncbi:MAG TPA: hypothetical protein VKW06_11835 [Candidatus Angelobacter sp.]|nr:hypothetical protein [Candidatus Angelobacter sp.]